MHVTPAYGRDYKSKAAIVADLKAGKDFLISSFGPQCGKPINLADLQQIHTPTLTVRYSANRKQCVIDLTKDL